MEEIREGGEYPRLDESPIGFRPIQFTDTGERANIVTIDGEPAALEPSGVLVEAWCEERLLVVVPKETLRDLRGDGGRWRDFRRRSVLGRIREALRRRE